VRMLHHFACTGGTLISRCIAGLPNTFVFSELDPLSPIGVNPDAPRFAPSDVVGHLNYSVRPLPEGIREEVFVAALQTASRRMAELGVRTIVREHTHSHYCTGDVIANRPSVRAILGRQNRVVSVVTVRDPVESFISLWRLLQGKLHFGPATFDEYCRRYLAFLDDCSDVPVIRYEDFTADPDGVISRMCAILELPVSETYAELLPLVRLTGNSGRSGDLIRTREAKTPTDALLAQAGESPNYALLTDRLGYERAGRDPAPGSG
jgi:hypothetical protein